jgi:hypothetical protein
MMSFRPARPTNIRPMNNASSSIFRRLMPALFFFLVLAADLHAGQEKELQKYNALYETGRFKEASEFGLGLIGKKRGENSRLLESLQTAVALRYDRQYELSTQVFEECEAMIRDHDEKSALSNVTRDIGATLVNDKAVDYTGTVYDGIMVNTYSALNYWQTGKPDMARVSFNRALDRQRRALERFDSEIRKVQEELGRQQSREQADASMQSDQVRQIYSTIDQYQAYPDFTNPFTSYVAGLFFMSDGDYPKAAGVLKDAYGISRNPVVMEDLLMVERMMAGAREGAHTWVVFEAGCGPVKEEWRIDLPLYLVTEQVKYTGIALPKLRLRESNSSVLSLRSPEGELGRTIEVASIDRVVQTEFGKRYPVILRRAIASAIVKTTIQAEAQQRTGNLGGFMAGLLQRATTSADLRIWTGLPKEFQVARVDPPAAGTIEFSTPDGKRFGVVVPTDRSSLVYVKIPSAEASPFVEVMPFSN